MWSCGSDSLIIVAAQRGDLKCLQLLIEKCPDDINNANRYGITPVHVACANDQVECLRALLTAGADALTTRDDALHSQEGWKTPLMKCVQQLRKCSSCKNAVWPRQYPSGYDLSLTLDESGDAGLASGCTCGKSHDTEPDLLEQTPQCLRVLLNHFESLGLEKSVYLDAQDKCGENALMKAVTENRYECVVELAKAGAELNAQNNFGHTAAIIACYHGFNKCLDVLIEESDRRESKKLDLSLAARTGHTAMHEATFTGHVDCLRSLIGAGADLNVRKPSNGKTPLMLAVDMCYGDRRPRLYGYTSAQARFWNEPVPITQCVERTDWRPHCVHLLTSHGADVNMVDADMTSALEVAVEHGNITIVSQLLLAGAQVDTPSSKFTATARAAEKGFFNILLILLSQHPDLTIQSDATRSTPLLLATKNSRADCVELLIKENPSAVHISDSFRNKTPYDYAAIKDSVPILNILLQYSSITRTEKCHATYYAASNGSYNCLKVLVQNNPDLPYYGDPFHPVRAVLRVSDKLGFIAKRSLHLLFSHGATVNLTANNSVEIADTPRRPYIIRLLKAAGLAKSTLGKYAKNNYGVDEDNMLENPPTLQDQCRDRIASHTLSVNPYQNMFHLVPRMPLPEPVKSFLLYDIRNLDLPETHH